MSDAKEPRLVDLVKLALDDSTRISVVVRPSRKTEPKHDFSDENLDEEELEDLNFNVDVTLRFGSEDSDESVGLDDLDES